MPLFGEKTNVLKWLIWLLQLSYGLCGSVEITYFFALPPGLQCRYFGTWPCDTFDHGHRFAQAQDKALWSISYNNWRANRWRSQDYSRDEETQGSLHADSCSLPRDYLDVPPGRRGLKLLTISYDLNLSHLLLRSNCNDSAWVRGYQGVLCCFKWH